MTCDLQQRLDILGHIQNVNFSDPYSVSVSIKEIQIWKGVHVFRGKCVILTKKKK